MYKPTCMHVVERDYTLPTTCTRCSSQTNQNTPKRQRVQIRVFPHSNRTFSKLFKQPDAIDLNSH